jgi:glycosyltransferase involved in cell wall biosynthesis
VPAERRRDWTLLFVGDGPLRGEVEAAAASAAPGEIARIAALPAADLAPVYAAADLLVFPSLGDPWGLVVNEALAAGLPVLCSALAGCADDLIRDDENGWCCDPTDPAAFSRALAQALASPELARMGARGRDLAKRLSPEAMAAGLRRAVCHAASLAP